MKARKGLAIAIMSKIPKPGRDKAEEGEEMEDEEGDDNEGYAAAFRSLRKAIESGNDEAGAEALKDFVDMCG